MTIENTPLAVGQVLFWPNKGPRFTTWHAGEVVDLNEAVKVVKLRFTFGKKMKSQWFVAVELRRSEPAKEGEAVAR